MNKNLASSFIVFAACISFNVVASDYYKYVDKEGNVVISNTLPAEYAERGYAVVTPRGNVVKVVPPRKTKAELAAQLAEEQRKLDEQNRLEAIEKEKEEQARKDEILLKTFATEEAILRNRDDKINSIQILESITHGNIERLKKQLEQAETLAAQHERTGKLIPQTVSLTIEESKRQIQENEEFLERKAIEKQSIIEKYDNMIERFKTLTTE